MQQKRPVTYKDWLNEIHMAVKTDAILEACARATVLSQDKNTARHDIALLLAIKYKAEMLRAKDNAMLIRDINAKFDELASKIAGSKFKAILSYVIKTEPSFDVAASKGQVSLGYIRGTVTKNKDGQEQPSLGFVGKPRPKVDESGKERPGLGFVGGDSTGSSGLGFI